VQVRAPHDLLFRLHHHQPIAVISAIELSSEASCSVLRGIAAYNPDLPVMLLAPDEPSAQGTIDAAEQLWSLTAVTRVTFPPDARDLIGFLFHAGRRCSTGRLIPLF